MGKPGISVQLIVYGGRQNDDLAGVLGEIAGIGYDAAEIGSNFIDSDRCAVRSAFEEAHIRCSGIHSGYGQAADPAWQDKAVDFLGALGIKYVICSGVADAPGIAAYEKAADVFNAWGEKCRANGLVFCYHNHAWEFESFDGVKGIHRLLELTDPGLVKWNMDVYWVTVGGEVPADLIAAHADRVGYYHFKDGPYTPAGAVTPGPYQFAELGKGTVDLKASLDAAVSHGAEWIVYEQDSTELTPEQAARISFEHLKTLGI